MKKITLSLVFGLISLVGFSQIGLVENFDASVTLPAGWSSDPGDYAVSFVQNCDGWSVRSNFNDTNLTGALTSPNVVGQSNGTDLTIAFDYKIVDWSAATDPTPPGWGELYVQYSTNDGGSWDTVLTINDVNHVTSNECANISATVPAASLPVGSDFKLRIDAAWAIGTYYVYLDNIAATQVVSDPPSCVNLITPTNGSTGVGINTNLEWSAATGIPQGYVLSVGTVPGGTDIVDNLDVGLSTTFNFPTALEYSTTYYVTVLAYNANGPAVGCTEFSFTTGADPNAPVDCASGVPVNIEYCYTDNDTMSWNFQSSDGGPLNIFFNAGQMESCCDDIIIYDGPDNTAPVLFNGNNGGDLTGISRNTTGSTLYVEMDTDGSVNCQGLGYVPINFDVSCIDLTAIPNCNSVLTTPANGDVAVDINTDITWSAASVIVTGYTISIGTTPGGTDILDNFDNGNSTTYDPGTLLYETTYYITIVPYNDNGSAINCNEQSFTTENDPNQILDCDAGDTVNTVYCYSANDTMTFNFASNNGDPLLLVFNAGWIEAGWDELIVTDSDGTILFQGDNGGDLTGLSWVSSGSTIEVSVDSDGSVSCDSGNQTPWDFTVSCFDPTSAPDCNASLTNPVNGATDVNENEDLIWTAAFGQVDGYILSIGTTPGGTDVVDNLDVGDVLTYDPGTLAFETTYYVTIVPYNANGNATGCVEESFTTRPDPNQILDCSINETINTTYCYASNDTMEFNFASNDGSQLVVFFNAGWIEAGWDELIITDSDGTIIFQGDNGGDLAGLFFISSGSSITVGVDSDGSVSCGSTGQTEWDFDVQCFDATAVPNCNAVMTTPADGGIDIDINTDITWTAASILVDGYTISIGTTPGGTDIVDNLDVGNVLTYDPGVLDNATNYYVTIVPYNSNGPAVNCTEYTFKTICIPQVVSFNAVGDCETDPNNPDFVIEVNITDLSGSASIIVSDDQGSPDQTASTTGIVTMGPYTANTVVTITTIKSDDDTCDVISSPITFICPPPPNPCSIVYAGEDADVDCLNPDTDLTANFHLFGQDTSNYTINGLDTCPLPPVVGGTPTSLDIDDRWSEVIDIGFDFCFFGGVYNQILVGSNGVLSFELENAGNFNGWNIDPGDTLPNNDNPSLTQANIFGVAHDIDPGVCGDINYLVIGSAPYRMFVVNYTSVCHFSCNSIESSSQIILYESSNNIDVNVFEKPICPGWNDGNAVIGVQNIDDTVAFTPVGRNTGVWEVTPDAPESYRFAPSEGTPNYTFEWLDENGVVVGNTETITVSPTMTTTYTASVTYELCTGGTSTVVDQVVVNYDNTGAEDPSFTLTPTCDGATATITGTVGGTFAFNPDPADGAVIDPDTGTITNGVPESTYSVEYTTGGVCSTSSIETVTVLPADDASFTMTPTCDGATATITGTVGGTFALNPPPGDGALIDPVTGTITDGVSGTTYTVEYTTSGACPETSTQNVTVLPADDASFTLTPTCDGATATITGTTGGTFAFNPLPTDGAVIDPVTGEIFGSADTTYTVEYTTSGVCPETSTQTVTAYSVEDASFTILTPICDGVEVQITGDLGGTFAFNPEPNDGAMIDPDTGEVTGGSQGTEYTIEYTTSGPCPEVSVQSFETLACVIPQVITPNDDGYNDTFDLSSFDVESLVIYNRNGTEIFKKTDGYTNEFYGVADNGDELPVGTYFYVMKYQDGKVRTSWVYINK
ncbi:T9SS type B sorting domain-containing protein [Hanstruepera marina]|uniref:T9SS type B sorting domain-containing protein n=1 Tax=Hanstruepera marina TaxID=2873265 RepID=UPI001CA63743|nr:gliding motility-associated C-terminal domain-containing protein [Hanstruepera marina]